MSKNYEEYAKEIINGVGGKKNIIDVKHCFTRLRFRLKDNSIVDVAKVENVDMVVKVMKTIAELQVVIGNEIDDIYKAVKEELGDTEDDIVSEYSEMGKKNLKWIVQQILNAISSTVSPILVGLVVAGLFKAVLVLLSLGGILSNDSQTYELLNMAGDSFFYFMPLLVAHSASKYFGCNTVVSLMLAGILLHPTFSSLQSSGEAVSLFGLPVHMIDYSASLISMLITVWIQSYVEKLSDKTFFKKLGLLVQFPVFLIMVPLTLLVTGPIGSIIGEIIANGMLTIYGKYALLGIVAICLLMPLFIWTGSHWVFMPVAISNVSTLGFDPFLWVGFAAWNFTQLAVSMVYFLKSKNKKLKTYAASAAFSIATAGISEPCAYGLTLKFKKPIIPSFIGCGIGGLIFGLLNVKVFQLINVSIISLPQFIDPNGGNNFLFALIGIVCVFVSTFLMVWFWGFDESEFEKDLE